jgi:membrane-bound lytic murein transglycosylase B
LGQLSRGVALWFQNEPTRFRRKLASLGYAVMEFAGRLDFDQCDTIRALQVKYGLVPDGHPTPALLDRLGIAVR